MFYVLVSEIIGAGYNPLDYTMKVRGQTGDWDFPLAPLPLLTLGSAPAPSLQADRSEKGNMLAFGLWVNYQSKFIEFFDTFFMLVRKCVVVVVAISWGKGREWVRAHHHSPSHCLPPPSHSPPLPPLPTAPRPA
jgi:hypothetical protein